MLKVTIELWPYGLQSEKRVVSESLLIWNTGGNIEKGDYECCFGIDQKDIDKRETKKIKGHIRNEGAWKLLYKCLRKYYAT